MGDPADKGKFSTQIGDDVIRQALESVRKRTGDAPAVEVEVSPDAAGSPQAAPEPAAAASAPTPERKELESLKAQLEFSQAKGRELMEKIKDTHEKMLRAVADLDNFKKRAQKEKEEVQRFGVERLLKDVLPVADNLDRALEHAHAQTDYQALRKGVEMTRKLLDDTLGRHGVRTFSSKGKPFDPRLHEAMQQQETAEMPPGHVWAEVLRGYTLNDRLVRPALVVVTKPPALAEAPSPSAPSASAPGAEAEVASAGGQTGHNDPVPSGS